MTAREYLEQAYRLDQRIDSKLMQVSALRSMVEKRASIIRKDPIQHRLNATLQEEVIIKIVDMERETDAEIDRLVDLKREISRTIGMIDDPELQVLLELRYLNYLKWPEIAKEIHCTENNVYKMHRRALEKMEKIIPKDEIG